MSADDLFNRPHQAEIVERIQESPTIFTLRLRFIDPLVQAGYGFAPGQFNMLYVYAIGEVPISIVSDPEDETLFAHTIRAVGRVTRALAALKAGDRIGVRGPFGRGWPLAQAEGRDVVIVTGGLGCAPVVSVINYVLRRRTRFGRLVIMQGVKHACDLIWRERYERWAELPNTDVYVAADQGGQGWPFREGLVTAMLGEAKLDPTRSTVMMCGPEGMMQAVARDLVGRGFKENDLWLSMERNMQCGQGLCGHCQMGGKFVCKDGPVFSYEAIQHVLAARL